VSTNGEHIRKEIRSRSAKTVCGESVKEISTKAAGLATTEERGGKRVANKVKE